MPPRLGDITDYKAKKKELVERSSSVVCPIARRDDDISKRKTNSGRKKKYTPTRMKNEINKYFDWCEQADEIPSIKGMMIFLKMYKDMFYTYLNYPEYSDIMEHARMIISNWAETDVYNTKGMAAGKIAYMKNIHSWSDKLETNNTTEVRTITVGEAKAKIEMLAPRLLELLGSPTVINQLAHKGVDIPKSPTVIDGIIESESE